MEHQQHLQLIWITLHFGIITLTYGVNRESILNSLLYFDAANECVVPDLMHDVLQGYLPYKVKLMLKNYIRWEITLHAYAYCVYVHYN